MKKETIAAVFFGVVLGVGGAFILITRARQMSNQNTKNIPNTKHISPAVAQNSKTQLLELSDPKNASIYASSTMKIKGKMSKNSLIVIQSPIKEVVLQNEAETFQTDFPLALGENVISITAYAKDSKTPAQQKNLKIYYLDEK